MNLLTNGPVTWAGRIDAARRQDGYRRSARLWGCHDASEPRVLVLTPLRCKCQSQRHFDKQSGNNNYENHQKNNST